jgi:hypothetical protein
MEPAFREPVPSPASIGGASTFLYAAAMRQGEPARIVGRCSMQGVPHIAGRPTARSGLTMLNRSKTRILAVASLALAGVLVAGTARAGTNVQWSIGINAPLAPGVALGTVISNGPGYYGAPVYVQPAPVVYAPAPVVVAPPLYVPAPPVVYLPRRAHVQPRPVYLPRPVYGRPVPVIVRGSYGHGARGPWRHGRDDGRYAYGDR